MTQLTTKINETLGHVSSLFMSQECKGIEIVMPTDDLIKIGDELRESIRTVLREALTSIATGTDMRGRRWIELPDALTLINKTLSANTDGHDN